MHKKSDLWLQLSQKLNYHVITAIRGQGCFVNGEQISHNSTIQAEGMDTSSTTRLKLRDALVCVGFPISSTSALEASSRAVSALST